VRILAPHANATVPALGRVLLVHRPATYYPRWERLVIGHELASVEGPGPRTWLSKALTWPSRGLRYRANPRPLHYLLDLSKQLLPEAWHVPPSLLLVSDPDMSNVELAGFEHVWRCQSETGGIDAAVQAGIRQAGFGALVLLYADAIGLSWTRLEQQLSGMGITKLVITGRRRMFVHDRESARPLGLRRLAQRLWLSELLLAPATALLGFVLALVDVLDRRAATRVGE